MMMRFFPIFSGKIIYWKIRFQRKFKFYPTLLQTPFSHPLDTHRISYRHTPDTSRTPPQLLKDKIQLKNPRLFLLSEVRWGSFLIVTGENKVIFYSHELNFSWSAGLEGSLTNLDSLFYVFLVVSCCVKDFHGIGTLQIKVDRDKRMCTKLKTKQKTLHTFRKMSKQKEANENLKSNNAEMGEMSSRISCLDYGNFKQRIGRARKKI